MATTTAAEIDAGSSGDRAKKQTMTDLSKMVSRRPLMFEESLEPAIEGMSDEQRFLLDMQGYLLLEGALSPSELGAAQAGAADYLATQDPDPRKRMASPLWCHTKALESLCFHRSFWLAVMELLNGKPKLKGGQFINDDHESGSGHVKGLGGHLHCAREDWGTESATFEVDLREGHIRANDMIVFIYLTDVHEGDGGLAVLPGSHKNNFERPPGLYGGYGMGSRRAMREDRQQRDTTEWPLPESFRRQGMLPMTFKAGDIMLMPEATTHAVLPWTPTDRPRHVIGLRYHSQHLGGSINFPDDILARLSPNTRELLQYAHYTYTKGIALQPQVALEEDITTAARASAAL